MSARLPILGESVVRGEGPAPSPLAVRARVPLPTIAVLGAAPIVGGHLEMAVALVGELAARGHGVGAILVAGGEPDRVRSGTEEGVPPGAHRLADAGAREVLVVPHPQDEGVGRLSEAYRALASVEVVVAVGEALPLRMEPTLTVLITGGLSPIAFGPVGRAMRDFADACLSEARPGFARALAEGMVAPVGGAA